MAEEPTTHEYKLYNLLNQMIQRDEEGHTTVNDIKDIVIYHIKPRYDDDASVDDVDVFIKKIMYVLFNIINHDEYPYARIAVEEIDKIAKILYPGFNYNEAGEEY